MTITRWATQPTPTIAALFTQASVAAATPLPAATEAADTAPTASAAATPSPAASGSAGNATPTLAATAAPSAETALPTASATATTAASATASGLSASATPALTTAGAAATATAPPAQATVANPSATPAGNATATPTATATATATTPPAADLVFAGTRGYFDQTENAYRVVGEIVNTTAVYQQMLAVTGSFYGDQDQLVADDADVLDYLPQAVIPPNGRVPFEILVPDLAGAARFDLVADAVESLTPIREFTPTNLTQVVEFDRYCVRGTVQNSGDRLDESLVVVVVLYDAQASVVNYGDFAPSSPFSIFGTRVLNFQVCVSPPNDNVARYEVRVLGR